MACLGFHLLDRLISGREELFIIFVVVRVIVSYVCSSLCYRVKQLNYYLLFVS
jgi:hypothetical protein